MKYGIAVRRLQGHTTPGQEKQRLATDEQDRIAEAELRFGQTSARLTTERGRAGDITDEKKRRDEINHLDIEGINAAGERKREILEAEREYTLASIEWTCPQN